MRRFKPGDEVYAASGRSRRIAECIAIDENDVAIKPKGLTMEEAASIPLVGLTAWQVLVERAELRRGQKVLIHAGSGGVGTFAIQLAKQVGATAATTTSTANVEWVRRLGADVVIDYRRRTLRTCSATMTWCCLSEGIMSAAQNPKVTWTSVPTRTITAGGVEFAYRELGTNNPGTPVVFLIDLAAVLDKRGPRVVDGVAAKHHVVAFDNRGVGASSSAPATSIEQMADDAIMFIKAMGFEQVDLFGFSMGGMIAQEIALMAPHLVRKMIVAGTGPAGGEGIAKVAVSRTSTCSGACSRGRTRSSACSSPGRPAGSAPAKISWRDCGSALRTGTRKSP